MNAELQPWAGILAAGIALTGVVISVIVSALIARRANYINSVTAERSKWIGSLREKIAEFVGLLGYGHYQVSLDDNFVITVEYDKIVRRTETLVSQIKLQLNPQARIDGNIISLLNVMPSAVERENYRDLEKIFIRHVQWLLKEEWEKVKLEASGVLRRPWHWWRQRQRENAYTTFANGAGSIAPFAPRSN